MFLDLKVGLTLFAIDSQQGSGSAYCLMKNTEDGKWALPKCAFTEGYSSQELAGKLLYNLLGFDPVWAGIKFEGLYDSAQHQEKYKNIIINYTARLFHPTELQFKEPYNWRTLTYILQNASALADDDFEIVKQSLRRI